MRVQIVQIPPQAAEQVLPRLKHEIDLSAAPIHNPPHIPLHIPVRVPRAQDRDLRLQQVRERLCPLVRTRWMAKTRVEEHEAVKVRVVRLEHLRLVHRVEVVHERCNLHLRAQTVLDDPAKGIARCAFGEREFGVPVRHAFWPDENEVNSSAWEDVREL